MPTIVNHPTNSAVKLLSVTPSGDAGIAFQTNFTYLGNLTASSLGALPLTGGTLTGNLIVGGQILAKDSGNDCMLSFFATSSINNIQSSNFANSAVKSLLINQYGGNVGIGVASSAAALTVGTNSYSGNAQTWNGLAPTQYGLTLRQYSPSAGVVGYAFDCLNSSTNYANVLTIDRNKVGINTAPSGYALNVNGSFYSATVATSNITVQGIFNADFAIRSGDGVSYFDFYAQYGGSRMGIYDAVYGTTPFTLDGGTPSGMFALSSSGLSIGGSTIVYGDIARSNSGIPSIAMSGDSGGGIIQFYDLSGNPTYSLGNNNFSMGASDTFITGDGRTVSVTGGIITSIS
jgi:hypothetical protein